MLDQVVHNIKSDNVASFATTLLPGHERYDPASSNSLQSFPLPYRAVLLICRHHLPPAHPFSLSTGSHKTRDKKCQIAADLMIPELKRAIEEEGWQYDEHGDLIDDGETSMEQWPKSEEERHDQFEERLRSAARSDVIGIFKCSHIGGHRYAGATGILSCMQD
jgi:hypothetical protein